MGIKAKTFAILSVIAAAAPLGAAWAQDHSLKAEMQRRYDQETLEKAKAHYGAYQCGPYKIVLDNTWWPGGLWDAGIHYHVSHSLEPSGNLHDGTMVFGFPNMGQGTYTLYAQRKWYMGEPRPPEENYQCSKIQ